MVQSPVVVAPQAGTFEERSQTKWAKERLTELLVAVSSSGVKVSLCIRVVGECVTP